jgi:uncharacterized membrane-anchored protein
MRVIVDDAKSVVEVWLMKTEKDTSVKDIITKYKPLKYTVAIFRSGTQNLASSTSALLANNI